MADSAELFIRLLGPVTGLRQGHGFPLGTPRQQAVLSILASHTGRIVPMSQLIDGVWGQEPPRSAEQSVYTYIAGLRMVLEPERKRREQSTLLIGTSGGYLLRLAPRQIDCSVFADHLNQDHHLREAGNHLAALSQLSQALELWKGQALSGVPGPFAEAERARLDESRLTALEQRADSMIRLCRYQEALPGLQELTRNHPLRERPRELLMLALHHCGRRADALEVYQEGRRLLVDELGVDPGEGLTSCHELILRSVPKPAPSGHAPRQLPRDLLGFVGRQAECMRLKSLLAPWDETAPAPLVAISGPPGCGKSALAVRVSYLVNERYPDGQLYVNLRGATPGVRALEPLDVLGRFLRALGQPAEAVPAEVDEAAATLRDLLNGRQALIVLDDAARVTQIQPFLSMPLGNAIMVTSRETLTALDDCVQINLGTLRDVEAVTMLAKLAGADRTSADPAATTKLVRLCDGLPLALRIAGARLADRPDWSVADLAGRLEDERRRLHELEMGDRGVRSSLITSWTSLHESDSALDRGAARALAMLGVLGVPDVSAEVVAALLDRPRAEAERALERLVDAHLVECGSPGRYHMHDLVRLFASELATAEVRSRALARALSFYAISARSASVLRDPHRVQPEGPVIEAIGVLLSDEAAAHAWLVQEEPNLVAAASQAMADPDRNIACLGVALNFALRWYLEGMRRGPDLINLNQQARYVSALVHDERMEMHAVGHVAIGLSQQERFTEALALLQRQLTLCRRLGDRFGEQRSLGNLSAAHSAAGEHEEALRYARAQLKLARAIGAQVGERFALMVLGEANHKLGQLDEASTDLQDALTRTQQSGDVHQQTDVRIALGRLSLDRNDPQSALRHFEAGLSCARSRLARGMELQCLVLAAQACRLLDQLDDASRYINEALPLAQIIRSHSREKLVLEEQAAIQAAYGSRTGVTLARLI